ncbi:MAG: 3-deoxy-D-manno-octulosonic acid transferase [Chthonomonadales bacterium]
MYRLYNLLLILLSPPLAIFLALRLLRGKSKVGWEERWGKIPAFTAEAGGKRIWVHAASVGEVMAATPILEAYRKRRPLDRIILSVITPGGHEVATAQIGKTLDAVIYAPFDVPFAVRRAIRQIQPDLYINLETEIWPNMLHLMKQSGAKLALVNGRISDKSLTSYRRFAPLFRWALSNFHFIMTQSDLDSERYISIGADSKIVEKIGNAKFDQAVEMLSAEQVDQLKKDLGIETTWPVMVAGSTREAAEEKLVWESYLSALKRVPNLALIHAPRHVDRAEELRSEMVALGMTPILRTEVASAILPNRQIVLNTFGELSRIYGIADLVFIGNSLTPPGGGQNILQPLAHGKRTICGPYMQNFRDVVAMTEKTGAIRRVKTAEELATEILAALDNREECESMGRAAQAMIEANRGTSERVVDRLVRLVESA